MAGCIPTRRWAAALVAVAVAVQMGCVRGGGPDPFREGGSPSLVRLTVQNNDFKDAAVYAVWSGSTRRRVGTVTGKTSSTLTFEWVSDVVRFEVDFVAGGTLLVDPIDVAPGDHLNLVILDQG